MELRQTNEAAAFQVRPTKRYLGLAFIALLTLMALSMPATGTERRWTAADAYTVLFLYPAAGDAIGHLVGAENGLDIRPIPDFYGNQTYCAEDWHVIALAAGDAVFSAADGTVYTFRDVRDYLGGLRMEFFLDGQPISVWKGPIVPSPGSFWRESIETYLSEIYGSEGLVIGKIYGRQWGRVLSPKDLAVGEHTLDVAITGTDEWEAGITFTVEDCDA